MKKNNWFLYWASCAGVWSRRKKPDVWLQSLVLAPNFPFGCVAFNQTQNCATVLLRAEVISLPKLTVQDAFTRGLDLDLPVGPARTARPGMLSSRGSMSPHLAAGRGCGFQPWTKTGRKVCGLQNWARRSKPPASQKFPVLLAGSESIRASPDLAKRVNMCFPLNSGLREEPERRNGPKDKNLGFSVSNAFEIGALSFAQIYSHGICP